MAGKTLLVAMVVACAIALLAVADETAVGKENASESASDTNEYSTTGKNHNLGGDSREASLSCSDVAPALEFCIPFVVHKDPTPSTDCCMGARGLVSEVKSHEDLVQICECIQGDIPDLPGYDALRVVQVTQLCGLSLTFPPVDTNTNCAAI